MPSAVNETRLASGCISTTCEPMLFSALVFVPVLSPSVTSELAVLPATACGIWEVVRSKSDIPDLSSFRRTCFRVRKRVFLSADRVRLYAIEKSPLVLWLAIASAANVQRSSPSGISTLSNELGPCQRASNRSRTSEWCESDAPLKLDWQAVCHARPGGLLRHHERRVA
jgi:hypothetical protein